LRKCLGPYIICVHGVCGASAGHAALYLSAAIGSLRHTSVYLTLESTWPNHVTSDRVYLSVIETRLLDKSRVSQAGTLRSRQYFPCRQQTGCGFLELFSMHPTFPSLYHSPPTSTSDFPPLHPLLIWNNWYSAGQCWSVHGHSSQCYYELWIVRKITVMTSQLAWFNKHAQSPTLCSCWSL